MKYMIKKIKKFIKLILKKEQKRAKIDYTIEYKKNYILKDTVLFESYHGTQISSNEFYLLKDLYYRKDNILDIYVTAQKKSLSSVRERLDYYGLSNVKIVTIHTKEYCKLLCEAKYLINSTSFPDYFIKRKGQIYLNTWHGTPLKNMGRMDFDEPHMITNIQRNFLMSDYILFPNEHTRNIMEKNYMLSNVYRGKYILEGYPRNDAFYCSSDKVREELGLEDKKVIVYMPTWRGKLGRHNNMHTIANVYIFLETLSNSLSDNEVVYVSFHYLMAQQINLNDFKNIYKVPKDIETYDFLNVADVLITDYSSVMFDFANANKKIALYQFDYQEYENSRGISIDVSNIPFYASNKIEDIITYIKSDISGSNNFDLNNILAWESGSSAKKINDFLFENKQESVTLSSPSKNDKKNLLIYSGNLAKNGITTSILSLLSKIDTEKFNIYLTFSQNAVKKNKNVILNLDPHISYIPFRAMVNYTYFEAFILFLYFKISFDIPFFRNIVDSVYKRDFQRIYAGCDFEHVIQFSGYDRHIINLFGAADIKKSIYVHNDMWKEYKIRNFCHKPTMDMAYTRFDNVALVNKVLSECFGDFKVNKDNFVTVENLHPHNLIVEKSNDKVMFDEETKSTILLQDLKTLLDDKTKTKFINIGRFSAEKGHDRLISAFEKVYMKNNKCYLIIIGGPGQIYKNTLSQARTSVAASNIIIIHSIRNPFSILKHCDLFILSSHYEGLGLVMLEAISLGVPVVSTDIPAPRAFLEQGYGDIVENTEQGLFKGMSDFLDGKIRPAEVDWNEYNDRALSQFNKLLD